MTRALLWTVLVVVTVASVAAHAVRLRQDDGDLDDSYFTQQLNDMERDQR